MVITKYTRSGGQSASQKASLEVVKTTEARIAAGSVLDSVTVPTTETTADAMEAAGQVVVPVVPEIDEAEGSDRVKRGPLRFFGKARSGKAKPETASAATDRLADREA